MSKSMFVRLLTSAFVNGVVRRPDEGVLHLDEAEAKRLIDNAAAEDVTADFTAEDRKEVPVEALDANAPSRPDLPPVEHQSNILPDVAAAKPEAPEKPARGQKAD